ncbi:hypothetical protein GCM10020370_55000 [Paenibacillus hodogayensis]
MQDACYSKNDRKRRPRVRLIVHHDRRASASGKNRRQWGTYVPFQLREVGA